MNGLPLVLSRKVSSADLYADDTTIYDVQTDLGTLGSNLQESLLILQRWCKQNGMVLNTGKTKVMLISTRQKRIRLDTSLLSLSYNASRKLLRKKVVPDLHLTYSKNGGNLGLVLKMKNIACISILLTKHVKNTYIYLFKFVLYNIAAFKAN